MISGPITNYHFTFSNVFFGKLAYIRHIYNLLFYLPLLNKYFCGNPSIPPSNIKWETCWEVRRAFVVAQIK